MKKLHTFAFCALVTPVITFGAGPLLAENHAGQDMSHDQESSQYDNDATQATPRTTSTERASQSRSEGMMGDGKSHSEGMMGRDDKSESDAWSSGDQQNQYGQSQSRMQHKGYMSAAPAGGMHTDDLIGAEVKTMNDEEVGPVNELIIDESGQIVAIVIGVGGFLGMGERDVAIGWDDVTKSGTGDELELQIDVTREGLSAAPEFEDEDDMD